MNGKDGKWIGLGVGDKDPDVARTDPNWHSVTLLNQKLHDKYQWARDMGVAAGDTYTETTAKAVGELQKRVGIPPVVDPDGKPVADFRTRVRLGSYPPPPPPRHKCLTFSGTWAAPGTGYPSWVAQACNVDEIAVQSPWSFGFIGGNGPSYRQSVDIAVDNAVGILENSTFTFMLGGYSQGGEAASRVYHELLPGGRLEHRRDGFVAGYTFGNPCRQKGHTFYGGRDPGGQGISSFTMSGMDWNWADMAQPGDIYTTRPGGQVGKDMTDVYELAIDLQLNDPLAFFQAFLQHIMALAGDLGLMPQIQQQANSGALGGLGGILGMFGGMGGLMAGGPVGLLALAPGLLIPLLTGLISGQVNENSTGLEAAVQAAVIGLKFIMAQPPTAPHITYEFGEAIPGMTYIDLARQHVNDWAARVPVRT